MNAKPIFVLLLFSAFCGTPSQAQRKIQGSGFDPGGGGLNPKVKPAEVVREKVIKKLTYVAVAPLRSWTSKEGKNINGTMLAFDAESSQPGEKKPLSELVLVQEGKVRLLVEKKVYVIALDKLSDADRKFVADLEARRKAVAEGASIAAPKSDEQTSK